MKTKGSGSDTIMKFTRKLDVDTTWNMAELDRNVRSAFGAKLRGGGDTLYEIDGTPIAKDSMNTVADMGLGAMAIIQVSIDLPARASHNRAAASAARLANAKEEKDHAAAVRKIREEVKREAVAKSIKQRGVKMSGAGIKLAAKRKTIKPTEPTESTKPTKKNKPISHANEKVFMGVTGHTLGGGRGNKASRRIDALERNLGGQAELHALVEEYRHGNLRKMQNEELERRYLANEVEATLHCLSNGLYTITPGVSSGNLLVDGPVLYKTYNEEGIDVDTDLDDVDVFDEEDCKWHVVTCTPGELFDQKVIKTDLSLNTNRKAVARMFQMICTKKDASDTPERDDSGSYLYVVPEGVQTDNLILDFEELFWSVVLLANKMEQLEDNCSLAKTFSEMMEIAVPSYVDWSYLHGASGEGVRKRTQSEKAVENQRQKDEGL